MVTPTTRRAEYYWLYAADIDAGYFIAGNNLPPLPYDPSGQAPYNDWPMPTWMPQQVFIIEACVGYECPDINNADLMEIEFWVDPGGFSFNSTSPVGLEANFERDITIIQAAQCPLPREHFAWSADFSACPVLWNRSAGDLLVCKIACSRTVPWISLEIRWPIPNTIAIPPLGPGY